MALDKLTIINNGGLSTTSDYRVGVLTATKFVGPIEGGSATFTGNVSIGGTLTYEDVTNIDSVGLITARNGIEVSTGTATTALVVNGNARVTGILTVGTGSLTLNGPNNLVNVGTALTLGHTQGLQFHTQNLHSAGFEVNQVNSSGIITATGADINGDIDVDGQTDLDVLNVAELATFESNIDANANLDIAGIGTIGSGASGYAELFYQGVKKLETKNYGASLTGSLVSSYDLKVNSYVGKLIVGNNNEFSIKHDNTNTIIDNTIGGILDIRSQQVAISTHLSIAGVSTITTLRLPDNTSGSVGRLQLGNGLDLSLFHDGTNSFLVNNTGYLSIQSQDGVNGIFIQRNAEVNLYYGNSVRLQTSSAGITVNRDLDVDGHTNLDNVSIAGVTTVTDRLVFDNATNAGRDLEWQPANNRLAFFDVVKATFGNNVDLQIYHTGNDSLIYEGGTGNLSIQSTAGEIQLAKGGSFAHMVRCIVDGAVELYHNGSQKLSTSTAGISVTGEVSTTGHIRLPDNMALIAGNGSDLFIYHDGSSSVIDEVGTGSLKIQTNGTGVDIQKGSSETIARFIADGEVQLYHNNVKTFFTTSAGIQVQGASGGHGQITLSADANEDNADKFKLVVEDGGPFKIQNRAQGVWETNIECNGNGNVELYHNNSKKFETSSSGATVTGDLTATNDIIITGSGEFYGYDNSKIVLGHGRDVQIYHTGTNSYIVNNTGTLHILTDTFEVKGSNANETHLKTTDNGSVELYYNNSLKLNTSSAGVIVTNGHLRLNRQDTNNEGGELCFNRASDNANQWFNDVYGNDSSARLRWHSGGTEYLSLTPNSSLVAKAGIHIKIASDSGKFLAGNSDDLQLFHDGSESYVKNANSSSNLILESAHGVHIKHGGENMAKFVQDGAVELYHDNSKKFETTSGGSKVTGNFIVNSGSVSIDVDGQKLLLGAGDDLSLWHDGSHSYIKNTTNYTYYRSTQHRFQNAAGTENQAIFYENGAVDLYHNNTLRLSTTSSGVDVDGNITCDDIITAGALLHEGDTNTLVHFTSNDEISLKTNGSTRIQVNNTTTEITNLLKLPTSDAGISFGPGDALNDMAHIEWRGGNNAGYLRISVDDDADSSGNDEYIEFGDYSLGNRGGSFTQHVSISRGQFLVRTGAHDVTQADRFKIDKNGNCYIYGTTTISGVFQSTQGIKFGPSNQHYLYHSATNTVSLRITSDGPYAMFQDSNGEVKMGSASGTLNLAAGGDTKITVTSSNTSFAGDIYLNGELNMTTDGNKNRFIDCSMDGGEALFIRSTINGDANHHNMALFKREGSVDLYYNNSPKFYTANHGATLHGDLHMSGGATSTNQNRTIKWDGFDKEATTDYTDYAQIRHTTGQHGITGSVLQLESYNDSNDGIALNASGGSGQIVFNGQILGNIDMSRDGSKFIPSFGTGSKGIRWNDNAAGGGGDAAHIQYYVDGSGEDTRLRIHISNDAQDDMRLEGAGGVHVQGTFTASNNKGFRIPHVLTGLTTTTDLVHSAIEGPQTDNLYRGRTTLVAGISTVNIDITNNMTDGTFVNLNRDVQCFTTNETGWTAIKGSVDGNLLTIVAQDNTCTDTISWMVIGERWDLAMYDPRNPLTDENGKLKIEIPNKSYNKGGGYDEDYIEENKHRVGISTFSRPSIENKEVE